MWHRETSLQGFDAVVIPGGFTYGDYLRGGAIAALAPILSEVRRFAENGLPVLGICNGFQILTEAHILPGALVRNSGRKFVCRKIAVTPHNTDSFWTEGCKGVLHMPVAHNEGRYIADEETLERLEQERRVAFIYCSEEGEPTDEANPNGSAANIAGILNDRGNVLGLMPHPERVVAELLGGTDGRSILERLSDA